MAIDAYVTFEQYTGGFLACESTVDFSHSSSDQLGAGFTTGNVFEIDEWSQLSIENALTIGSQTTGTGGGRVEFKEFSLTKRVDKTSTTFFRMSCSGTPFKNVALAMRRPSGGDSSGLFFVRFDFKLAAVKTISWSHDDAGPKEELTFEYGGLLVRYCQQNADGSQVAPIADGWDRTKNIRQQNDFAITYKN
jgi:type VI protein secretion system component Hcp